MTAWYTITPLKLINRHVSIYRYSFNRIHKLSHININILFFALWTSWSSRLNYIFAFFIFLFFSRFDNFTTRKLFSRFRVFAFLRRELPDSREFCLIKYILVQLTIKFRDFFNLAWKWMRIALKKLQISSLSGHLICQIY